jgi:hypothetical protein
VKLKPYLKYKRSGIEWLGDVPDAWGETLIKYEASFIGGGTPSKDEPNYWNGEIPWVSPKDMKVDLILDTEDQVATSTPVGSPDGTKMRRENGLTQPSPRRLPAQPVLARRSFPLLRQKSERCDVPSAVRWPAGPLR